MISSKSFSSDLSKASSSQDNGTNKTKKKRVFLALSRPSSSSSSKKSTKDSESLSSVAAVPPGSGTLKPPKTSSQLTINKSSTLPRPPKTATPKTSTSSSSKPLPPFTSQSSSGSSTSGATPILKKRLPFSLSKTSSSKNNDTKLTKTSNLSFSELKKQHQLLLQEVETLKTQLAENELKNDKIVKNIQGKLEDSELSVTILKQDNQTKDAIISEKDTQIQELQSQLDRTNFDKERLLMVIESVQRDALTGEPIFHDDNLWQQAREENRSKMSHYTSLLDNMITTLQDTSTQLQEQEHCIKTSSQLVPQI